MRQISNRPMAILKVEGIEKLLSLLSTEVLGGVGIGSPDQLDWIARPDGTATDYPRHLTGATDHRLEGILVHAEQLATRWPITRNLHFGFADAQPRAIVKLHDGHAL